MSDLSEMKLDDLIKALVKIRDEKCSWGEISVIDEVIQLLRKLA